MDVRLPDGTVIKNVPEGTTQAELVSRLRAGGYDVSKLVGGAAPAPAPAPASAPASAPAASLAPVETVETVEEAPVAPDVTRGAEMRPYTPSLMERLQNLLPDNKARAMNELAARRAAAKRGVPVSQVYSEASFDRPMLNPEGRPTIQALSQAAPIIAKEIKKAPAGAAETVLRAVRGGDIGVDNSWLDATIKQLSDEGAVTYDQNYSALQGLGKSLGYSLVTMVSGAVTTSLASMTPAGPVAGVPAGMVASGTVAYRGSKDEFLDRVKDKLDKESKKLYGRPLNKEEWNKALVDYDSAASKYGAWEAIPEAVTNVIFLRAFSGPASVAKGARLKSITEKAAAYAADNVGETVTQLGQRAAEIEAGLSTEELTIAQAFRDQFVQTLVTSAALGGGLKGKELATRFYNERVLPRVAPGSALAKAIKADLEAIGYTPAAFRAASAKEVPSTVPRGMRMPVAPKPIITTPPEEPPETAAKERVEPTFEEAPPAAPTAPTAERVEPKFEEPAAPAAPTPAPAPAGEQIEPELGAAPAPAVLGSVQPRRPSIEAQVAQLKASLPFLSDEQALEIVKAREARVQVRDERRAAIEPPVFRQPEPGSPEEARLQSIFNDFLAKGVAPEQATALAQQQFALEQQEVEGGVSATEPISTPSGAGAGVAGVPPTGAPAEGAGGAERTGVVSPAEDVGQLAVGEGEQPSAITAEGLKNLSTETLQNLKDAFSPAEQKLIQAELDSRKGEAATETAAAEKPTAETTAAEAPPAAPKTNEEILAAATDDELAKALTQYGGSEVGRLSTDLIQAEIARREAAAAEAATTETVTTEPDGTTTTTTAETSSTSETAPKGKRGRPKLELSVSPEELALRQQKRREARTAYTRADRQATRAISLLTSASKFIDPTGYPDVQAYRDALLERAAQRREALRTLLTLEPQFRGTKLGNRIKEALQDPNISQKEFADVREGLRVTGGAKKSVFKEGVAPVNKALSSAKNANQALAAIISNGSPFQRLVAQRLRGLLNNTRFVVIEKGDPLPEEIKAYERDWNRANGMFIEPLNAVYVRGASFGFGQGVNNVTALHELLHAATVRKIAIGMNRFASDSPQYRQLQTFMADLAITMEMAKDVYERRLASGNVPDAVRRLAERTKGEVFTDSTEFLAYGMTDPDFQLFLMRVPGRLKDETAFSKFVRSIMKLFGIGPGYYSAFSDLVNVTDRVLSERMSPDTKVVVSKPLLQRNEKLAEQEGVEKAREITKRMDQAEAGLRKSTRSQMYKAMGTMAKIRDAGVVEIVFKSLYSKVDYKTKQFLANGPTFDFLARWTKDDLPMVKDTYEIVQKLIGHTYDLRETGVAAVQMLDKAFKKDKSLEKKLNDLVPLVTIMDIDPADPNSLEKEARLTRRYNDLGEDGQAAYRRIFNYFEDIRDYTEYLLDKNIKDMVGLDNETKTNLLQRIQLTMAQERRIENYMPLMRDPGQFFLAVGRGADTQVYTYETREQRAQDAARMAREDYNNAPLDDLLERRGDGRGEFAYFNNANDLRKAINIEGTLLSELFNAVDARAFDPAKTTEENVALNEQLKNDLFDIWLALSPEQGFRNQFKPRKNRPGYRPDIRRNIAAYATRISPAIARLRYGPELRSQQFRLQEATRDREDLYPFREAVDSRIQQILAPKKNSIWDAVAGGLNKLTYLTYLTGMATGMLQPIALITNALPVLMANHRTNPVRVAYELGKMAVLWNQYSIFKVLPDGSIKYTAPTLANNKTLPADERRAIRAMASMNVAQQTYAGFLFDADRGLEDDIVKGRGAQASDLLLNAFLRNAERLTRESAYLASYRLGRRRGLSEEEAISQAASDVKEALGDYDLSSRPEWMQGPLGKVLFAMKMWPLVTTQLLFGNMIRMIPILNKEGKAEAFYKFSGIVMTTATIAGAYNMPFADLLITMLTKFLGEQDEDDLPEGLKQKDPVLWFKTVFMPQKLGNMGVLGVPLDQLVGEGALNALTGRAIGARVGLNDLWFRDGKPSADLSTAAQSFLISFFPLGSYGTSLLKAYEDFMIGDYQKAMERSVPLATARNFLIASRIKEEGYETTKGNIVRPEDVTTADLMWQRMGFSPADVQAAKETSFKLTSAEQRTINQKNLLIRKLKFAALKKGKDIEPFIKVLTEEIPEFNRKNPDYAFSADSVEEILQTQAEQRARSRAGAGITEKNIRLFNESVSAMEDRLKRRQEK